jgi:ligand-binding SRPBCC domain-containing protein
VFRFFADPRNLPRLMPPELAAQIVRIEPPPGAPPERASGLAPEAGVGTEVTLSVRLLPPLPVRTPWVARIVEFVPGSHFVDVQVKGPFRAWRHRHGFERVVREGRDGTVVRDDVEFEVGLGAVGDAAARWFIRGRIRATFLERQRRLDTALRQKG